VELYLHSPILLRVVVLSYLYHHANILSSTKEVILAKTELFCTLLSNIKFQDPKLNGITNSEVRTAAMLMLSVVGYENFSQF